MRIDVSKGAKHVVTFVNNLEKDSMYTRWPRALKQLSYPTWSLHSIQRNLYTLLAVVDPVTLEGAALLLQLQAMHQQQYPLRFGVVLACEETQSLAQHNQRTSANGGGKESSSLMGEDEDPSSASSIDVCRLFGHAKVRTYPPYLYLTNCYSTH